MSETPDQEAQKQASEVAASGADSTAAVSGADSSAAGSTAASSAAPSAAVSGADASAADASGVSVHSETPSATPSGTSTSADVAHIAQSVSTGAGSASAAGPAESSPSSVTSKSQKSAGRSKTGPSGASAPPDTDSQAASRRHSPSPTRSGGAAGSAGARRKRMKLGELDLATAKIGFLGAGKMAESTINGLIHYAKISPGKIHVAAPSSKGLERFKALGCRVTKRNYDIFGRYDCDIVFLCFHGYVIKHCYKLGGTRPHPLTTNYIPHQRHPIYILSLVSGVSLNQIRACLLNPESTSRYLVEIHRIMMNTAVGHGLGICAVDCEPDSKKLSAPLRQLLSSIAHLEHVPASQMDAACAIGGSGLAFSYYFINALADGAFRMGLSRTQAIRFASKTAQCAAQTMLESGKHPAELRDNVSSPSGAAIYGIHVLEKNDVASGVTAAVEAAHKRANDLATQEVS